MSFSPALFPILLAQIDSLITEHAEEITELDQAIGDGDHVFNLQHGLQALQKEATPISQLDWSDAWQKIGMTLMSSVGGASGALYATLFINLAKSSRGQTIDLQHFASAFDAAINAVKQRGKSDAGEKTMLDVLIPVAAALQQHAENGLPIADLLQALPQVAADGAEATRNMLATKGRASFLGERSLGHIDAGAKTAALMISAIASVLTQQTSA